VNRILIALVVAVTGIAHAAPARPSRAPAAVDPVDHYEAGKRLFERKRYAEALEQLRLALSIAPRPEVLYSMAQAQRMLGDCASAVETYRAFLAGQPDEPFAGYARLNIERCERDGKAGQDPGEPVAWYRDVAGDALVGGGIAAAVVGAVVWRSGRTAALRLSDATDYQGFLERRDDASSAVTKQTLGISGMIVGGAAIFGGIVHYVRGGRPSRRSATLGIALTAGGAMLTGAAAL
jgi:tetratricopeptide (TPR) repeat protein